MSDSNDNLRLFIETYRNLPCLWRLKSRHYYNKKYRNAAYGKLVKICRLHYPTANQDFVVKRIKYIRNTFRKEWKKVLASKESGVAPDDVYEPSLWYYDLLLFTATQDGARPGIEFTEANEDDENTVQEALDILEALDENDINELNQIQIVPTDSAHVSVKSEYYQTKRHQSESDVTACSVKRICENMTGNRQNDEHDAFGIVIASKLRKMDDEQRAYCEFLIYSALHKGQRKKLTDNTKIVNF